MAGALALPVIQGSLPLSGGLSSGKVDWISFLWGKEHSRRRKSDAPRGRGCGTCTSALLLCAIGQRKPPGMEKWTPPLDGKSCKILWPCFPRRVMPSCLLRFLNEVTHVECFIESRVRELPGACRKNAPVHPFVAGLHVYPHGDMP